MQTIESPTPPRQARSRESTERMLQAAEGLLRRKSFEDITIAEIVRDAKTSVGSFYARFGSKEGMLPQLYERYDAVLVRRFERHFTSASIPKAPPGVLVRWLVEQRVRMFRRRRWLLHAVGLYARRWPERMSPALLQRRTAMHRRIAAFLAGRLGPIDHPDPVSAVQRAMFFVGAICRDMIVYPAPHARATALDDAALAEELSRMFLRYLGLDEASKPPETKRRRAIKRKRK